MSFYTIVFTLVFFLSQIWCIQSRLYNCKSSFHSKPVFQRERNRFYIVWRAVSYLHQSHVAQMLWTEVRFIMKRYILQEIKWIQVKCYLLPAKIYQKKTPSPNLTRSIRERNFFQLIAKGGRKRLVFVFTEIKKFKSFEEFKAWIKSWVPKIYLFKICKLFIKHVGYL